MINMQGIYLRLTHAGLTTKTLHIGDTDSVPPHVPIRHSGPIYIHAGAYIDILFTSAVAISLERGAIRSYADQGALLVSFIFGDQFSQDNLFVSRMNFVTSPGNTINESVWFPTDVRIWGVQCYAVDAPTTAGTYTLAVISGGNQLLSPATFDLTTLVDGVVSDVVLTATTANLELAAKTPMLVTVNSTLGDLTGVGLVIQISYGLR